MYRQAADRHRDLYVLDLLIARGIDGDKIIVVTNGIDPFQLSPGLGSRRASRASGT